MERDGAPLVRDGVQWRAMAREREMARGGIFRKARMFNKTTQARMARMARDLANS